METNSGTIRSSTVSGEGSYKYLLKPLSLSDLIFMSSSTPPKCSIIFLMMRREIFFCRFQYLRIVSATQAFVARYINNQNLSFSASGIQKNIFVEYVVRYVDQKFQGKSCIRPS